MTVFTCEQELEAMLTCIHVAWSSGLGHKNIRLEPEPVDQTNLFDEYIHVDCDHEKAVSVMNAVNMKISKNVYDRMSFVALSFERDALDTIYRTMILGFALGPGVLNRIEYRDVMRFNELYKRVSGEAYHFQEFVRFHLVGDSVYVAHIEPKSRVVPYLGSAFSDRMPSEVWMIVDDVHKEAVVHPKNEDFYIRKLNNDEFDKLLLSERENDEYTDMWKVFFDSIAIKERANAKCQLSHFPIWKRKHAVEFMNSV